MKKDTILFAILLVLMPTVTLGLGVLEQDSHSQTSKTTSKPGWSELAGDMEKMHAAMASVKPSGDSDVDFVKLMLPHHQAAIEMAKTQLMYGTDPQMRRLAQEIITDQQSEIELMQLWLKQHVPSVHKADPTPSSPASKEH